MLLVYYVPYVIENLFPNTLSWIITHCWVMVSGDGLLKPALFLMHLLYNSYISYIVCPSSLKHLFLNIICKFYKISPFWCMISFIFRVSFHVYLLQ